MNIFSTIFIITSIFRLTTGWGYELIPQNVVIPEGATGQQFQELKQNTASHLRAYKSIDEIDRLAKTNVEHARFYLQRYLFDHRQKLFVEDYSIISTPALKEVYVEEIQKEAMTLANYRELGDMISSHPSLETEYLKKLKLSMANPYNENPYQTAVNIKGLYEAGYAFEID